MKDHKIIMGRIASPYGVRGWSKVISFAQPIENLLQYRTWFIKHQGRWMPIEIEEGRLHGKWLIVRLAGCVDRDQAKAYTNDSIALDREQLATLPQNEYYWTDLVGLTVINADGQKLGQIDSLFETGANDVIVIKTPDNREILIPYIKSVVKSIDLKEKKMLVDWVEL